VIGGQGGLALTTTDNGGIFNPQEAHVRLHEKFEWDSEKALINARKHGVTFQQAARVLSDDEADRYHVEEFDDSHSVAEDRWITTGGHPEDRRLVLRIVWTPRIGSHGSVTRIIGARAVSRQERSIYEEEIDGR
jgi:uncharacterized protein